MGGRDCGVIGRKERIIKGRKKRLLIKVELGMMTSCCKFIYIFFTFGLVFVSHICGKLSIK